MFVQYLISKFFRHSTSTTPSRETNEGVELTDWDEVQSDRRRRARRVIVTDVKEASYFEALLALM